jgi:hypothetical protein
MPICKQLGQPSGEPALNSKLGAGVLVGGGGGAGVKVAVGGGAGRRVFVGVGGTGVSVGGTAVKVGVGSGVLVLVDVGVGMGVDVSVGVGVNVGRLVRVGRGVAVGSRRNAMGRLLGKPQPNTSKTPIHSQLLTIRADFN